MSAGAEQLEAIEARAREEIAQAQSAHTLTEVRASFLGRKGSVSQLLRGIGELAPEERGRVGQAVNATKQKIEGWVAERKQALEAGARSQALASGGLDVTLPGAGPRLGHLHPISRVMRDMVQFFTGLGFSIEQGPELDDEWHNFEALNIPKDHPARDEQDTFYVEGGNVLRTHTSNVQIRAMTGRTPPFRFVAPGRVYRYDQSSRHSPMFHQIEGFLVDDRVTLADLKGILLAFARYLMGPEIELRFRANHFPFTEPSAEIDVGFRGSWLEWGGCGMIHPRVLERCQIDPDRWQGFAFGMGIDRGAMRRYDIPHIRLLFESDLRLLEQI